MKRIFQLERLNNIVGPFAGKNHYIQRKETFFGSKRELIWAVPENKHSFWGRSFLIVIRWKVGNSITWTLLAPNWQWSLVWQLLHSFTSDVNMLLKRLKLSKWLKTLVFLWRVFLLLLLGDTWKSIIFQKFICSSLADCYGYILHRTK